MEQDRLETEVAVASLPIENPITDMTEETPQTEVTHIEVVQLPPPKKRGRPNIPHPVESEQNIDEEMADKIEIIRAEDIKPSTTPRKRGRPPKDPNVAKKRLKSYGDDLEWSDKRDVAIGPREAVVTRTRTGRRPRRPVYGDDFVSPFDTKRIKEALDMDKPIPKVVTGAETPKRARGRPPKSKSPVPSSSEGAPVKRRPGRPPKRQPEVDEDFSDSDADLIDEEAGNESEAGVAMETNNEENGDHVGAEYRNLGEPTDEELQLLGTLDSSGEEDLKAWLEADPGTSEGQEEREQETRPNLPPDTPPHISITPGISYLWPNRCTDKPDCNCGLLHCPLCPEEHFKPVNYPRAITKHIGFHEKYSVKFLDVLCCVCRLQCESETSFHYHCPVCGLTHASKSVFEKHLLGHTDVTYIMDPNWQAKSNTDKGSTQNTAKKTADSVIPDQPVLSNVTAVLTPEFLEHIGATEDTENFLKEKLAMEKVFVTKVSDQWIIHGQWEHIQKAYARLKKLHNQAKKQKIKDLKTNTVDSRYVVGGNKSDATDEEIISALNETKEEILDTLAVKSEPEARGDVGSTEDEPEQMTAEITPQDEREPKSKGPVIRRTKDEIKALGIKLKCRVCGLIKHSKDSLYRHIWRCHKEKKHSCEKCGRCYGQKSDMLRHQDICKGPKPDLPDADGDGPFKCTLCDKVLQTRETLKAHHKYLHTDAGKCVCHLCGKNFRAPRYLKSHLVRHSELRNYVCGVCGKGFKERGTLKEHLMTHKDMTERVRKFKCDLCPKAYFRHNALLDHMNFHAGRKPYACVECGRSFIGRCALNKHMLSHGESKTYPCDRCGKEFKFKHKLESHYVTHTGFSKHICSVCGKCFTTSTTLRKHSCKGSFQVDTLVLQNTANVSPDRQTLQLYMCSLCNLTFTEWTEVASHMLIHSEVGEGAAETTTDNGTVQIELQSQDLINLADAAASASLAAAGDGTQSEEMQSVINAIAQVQRMESGDHSEADAGDALSEAERALAQYNKIQIQDSNIVNVIQEGENQQREVTIHLEDQEQYQVIQEQLVANPEQFEIIREEGEDERQFQVIQDVTNAQEIQVIEGAGETPGDYQVIQDVNVDQGQFQIIQGDPGTQGQFQIIHDQASGQFQVIHGDTDQTNFQIIQGSDEQGGFQVIQESAGGDADFEVQEGNETNQFQVVPGSDSETRTSTMTTLRISPPEAVNSEQIGCNIGDIPFEQLTAVTHIAMDPAGVSEPRVEMQLVQGGDAQGQQLYAEAQEGVLEETARSVVLDEQAQHFE